MYFPRLLLAALVTVSSPLLAQLAVSNTSLPFGGLEPGLQRGADGHRRIGRLWICDYRKSSAGIIPNTDTETPGIQGDPTHVGTFTFTVTVTDFQTMKTASKQLSIGIMQISTPPQLPNANTCSSYSQALAVSDGPPPPFNWSFDDSPTPPGLNIDQRTGVISGMPTSSGMYGFTIEAFSPSANIFATQAFTSEHRVTLFPREQLAERRCKFLLSTIAGCYGWSAPLTFSVSGGTLPTGVTIDPNSGLLSGTPTVAGPYNFTVQVKDNAGAVATQSFAVTILAALAFTTTSPLPSGKAGTNYSVTFWPPREEWRRTPSVPTIRRQVLR